MERKLNGIGTPFSSDFSNVPLHRKITYSTCPLLASSLSTSTIPRHQSYGTSTALSLPQNNVPNHLRGTTGSGSYSRSGSGNFWVSPYELSNIDTSTGSEDEFSEKLIAYARYNRNNDRIKNILSDEMVPPYPQLVPDSRVTALQEQVRNLEDHLKKENDQIKEIKEKCTTVKRKFIESTEKYHAEYKKLCSRNPIVDKQRFEEMVIKQYAVMKKTQEVAEKVEWERTLAWAQKTAATAASSQSTSVVADILGSALRHT